MRALGWRFHDAWVVLGASFVAMVCAQGLRTAFGAFVPSWEREFGLGRAALATISGLSFLVYGFGQPIAGRLADRLGARTVLVAGLGVVGLGIGLVAVASDALLLLVGYVGVAATGFAATSGVAPVAAINRWFVAHRGLALGLVATAFAVGQLIVGPLSILAIEAVGWRMTLGIFAILLVAVLAPLVFWLVRSSPEARGTLPLGVARGGAASPRQHLVMRGPATVPHRAFWCLALPYFVCGITTSGLIDTHLVPLAHDHDLPAGATASAVGILAAFNIAGTLAAGWLADRFPRRTLLGLLYAGRAFALVLLLNLSSPILLFAFAVFFGLVDFSTVAPTTSLGTEYFASRRGAGTIVGILSLSHQIGSAVGSTAAGLLQQLSGSYDLAVMLAIVMLIAASVLSFALPAESRQPAPALATKAL